MVEAALTRQTILADDLGRLFAGRLARRMRGRAASRAVALD
jgi:hypothetical protein